MQKTILRRYARLIAVTGAGIQKGQQVIVTAELDQPEFVELLVDECYKAGAAKVTVEWSHQKLDKYHYRHRSVKTLQKVEDWEVEKLRWMSGELPCRIWLESSDPDGLKGINQEKMAKARQARYKVSKPFTDAMEGKYQWCIAAVPGAAWARKVFPGLSKKQAVEKLWEAILAASRVTEDPIAAWNEHNRDLAGRCAYLNGLGIEQLHYRASNGTDLTVGMMPQAKFCGGGETTLESGRAFNPNIPTEECFISPRKGAAEGIVYATKPLSYQGQLIENFWFRFESGRVVELGAEKNEELLKKMVAMDEGAAFLGECALVPFSSPINETGLLFYNTLFDENACCHLALGRGFIDTIRGFDQYTLEEMWAMGVNDSMIHEDFMIGTADLSVTALCRDGKTVKIFEQGTWAF